MTKTRKLYASLIVLLFASLLFSAAPTKADTFVTHSLFYVNITAGSTFYYNSTTPTCSVAINVVSGTLSGYVNLTADDTGGFFSFLANNSGTVFASATGANTTIDMNGVSFGAALPFTSGNTYVIEWLYGAVVPTPTPTATAPVPSGVPTLPTVDFSWLWLYLYQGDVLGFFQALFLTAFNIIDVVYGVICLLFLLPLYIKTKSLLLICILWILIGSFFIIVMPLVSGLAVIFMVLGVAGLLYRVFVRER